jgi:hypothetical protein
VTAIEFEAWPKTPRLFRNVVVTEKIDGTNAAVIIQPLDELDHVQTGNGSVLLFDGDSKWAIDVVDDADGRSYAVAAQSRKRLITPEADNYGFAAWVESNASALVEALGPGRHFGEWWGQGIQRRYGLEEKRFSLFNVHRYADVNFSDLPNVGLVPVLFTGPFSTEAVELALYSLRADGSSAAPGFMNPEGVIVYHTAAGQVFKALLENDDQPKGLVAA